MGLVLKGAISMMREREGEMESWRERERDGKLERERKRDQNDFLAYLTTYWFPPSFFSSQLLRWFSIGAHTLSSFCTAGMRLCQDQSKLCSKNRVLLWKFLKNLKLTLSLSLSLSVLLSLPFSLADHSCCLFFPPTWLQRKCAAIVCGFPCRHGAAASRAHARRGGRGALESIDRDDVLLCFILGYCYMFQFQFGQMYF